MHQPERRHCAVASGILISLFSPADLYCHNITHTAYLSVFRANSHLDAFMGTETLLPWELLSWGCQSPGWQLPRCLDFWCSFHTLFSRLHYSQKPYVSSWAWVAWTKNVTVFFVVHQKHPMFCALLF